MIKGDEDRTTRSLRNLQHPGKWKSPSQHSYHIYFICLLKKHPGNQVREGCRLPQKPTELKQTFPLFYILDLDLTCMFKSPFHLINIGTNINCREKGCILPSCWWSVVPAPPLHPISSMPFISFLGQCWWVHFELVHHAFCFEIYSQTWEGSKTTACFGSQCLFIQP